MRRLTRLFTRSIRSYVTMAAKKSKKSGAILRSSSSMMTRCAEDGKPGSLPDIR